MASPSTPLARSNLSPKSRSQETLEALANLAAALSPMPMAEKRLIKKDVSAKRSRRNNERNSLDKAASVGPSQPTVGVSPSRPTVGVSPITANSVATKWASPSTTSSIGLDAKLPVDTPEQAQTSSKTDTKGVKGVAPSRRLPRGKQGRQLIGWAEKTRRVHDLLVKDGDKLDDIPPRDFRRYTLAWVVGILGGPHINLVAYTILFLDVECLYDLRPIVGNSCTYSTHCMFFQIMSDFYDIGGCYAKYLLIPRQKRGSKDFALLRQSLEESISLICSNIERLAPCIPQLPLLLSRILAIKAYLQNARRDVLSESLEAEL